MNQKFIKKVAQFQAVEQAVIINEINQNDFALKIFDGFVVETYKEAALNVLPDTGLNVSISLDPLTNNANDIRIRVIHTTLGLRDGHRNIFCAFDSTESDTASIGAYAKGVFWYKDVNDAYVDSTFDKLHELMVNNAIKASDPTTDGGRFCLRDGFVS